MVFLLGGDNFVALSQRKAGGGVPTDSSGRIAEGVGEQVEGFGGVGGPDQLVLGGADEGGYGAACVLEGVGGVDGEGVGAAVDG